MKAKDISNYNDLLSFVRVELAVQGSSRKIVSFKLSEEWFFKFAKLIKHCLKDTVPLEQDCRKYLLKIDDMLTIVTR